MSKLTSLLAGAHVVALPASSRRRPATRRPPICWPRRAPRSAARSSSPRSACRAPARCSGCSATGRSRRADAGAAAARTRCCAPRASARWATSRSWSPTRASTATRCCAHAKTLNAPPGMIIRLPPAPAAGSDAEAQALRNSRAEMARGPFALLLSSPQSMPLEFDYGGEAEAADGKADVIDGERRRAASPRRCSSTRPRIGR